MKLYVVLTQANRGGGPAPGAAREDIRIDIADQYDARQLEDAILIAISAYKSRHGCTAAYCFGTYEGGRQR